jgi:succinyl-diaminopimelate desuccinylase
MPIDSVELCRQLLKCPSVTPQDGGSLGVLEIALKAAGFATHRVTFQAPGTPDIDNLYARIGTSEPCLVFAGHTDVVPVGDAAHWRFDPFSAELAEGSVWGRGAADMKGAIAAFAAAAIDHVVRDGMEKGSIGFLITGDEEGPSINGTEKLIRWAYERGERFDHCLVGEPTNPQALGDMIKIGRRGSLNGTLAIHGRQGHAAYPERAENPIPPLLRLAGALVAAPLDEGTAHFSASNLEIVSVDVGNLAFNIIPAEARARFNIRFNDLWTPETLAAELTGRLEAVAEGARYTLTFEACNALAFITEPDAFTELVAAVVEQETGRRPKLSTTGGTSDARFIRAFCPVLEFGLVGATMHMVDEHVAIADIRVLQHIYGAILQKYFKIDESGLRSDRIDNQL